MTTTHDQRRWRLRAPVPVDRDRWGALYRGYAGHYGVEQADRDSDQVWFWLMDPAHEVNGLLVVDENDHPVGLAHYRPFARPLSASTGCFLDDLFVDPAHRGGGAADALLVELRRLAGEHGWNVVRWITADNNYRGRAKYDQYAQRTTWVTYDMGPDRAEPSFGFAHDRVRIADEFDAPLPDDLKAAFEA